MGKGMQPMHLYRTAFLRGLPSKGLKPIAEYSLVSLNGAAITGLAVEWPGEAEQAKHEGMLEHSLHCSHVFTLTSSF